MLYCQRCEKEIDEDLVFCPKCGGVLVWEGTESQEFQIQEEIDEAKDRANMYIILAVVLVTVGMVGGGVSLISSSVLGFFGIVFVCLGIGCTAAADRYGRKARSLEKQLSA